MSRSVLLDTSFVVALLDAQDVHHPRARAVHESFVPAEHRLVLADLVVLEAANVLLRRAEERRDPARAASAVSALREWCSPAGAVADVGSALRQLLRRLGSK